MKGITTALFILMVALQAQAKDPKDSEDDFCTFVSTTAASIMKTRQSGAPMSKVIAAFKEEKFALFRSLTIEAYDSPRYSTENMQGKAVQDFENKAYLDCYKATNTK